MPEQKTHLCPIQAGAGGLISKEWCIDTFAQKLKDLPEDLREDQIVRPEFLLWEEKPLSIYYVPFERVNPEAKIFLVGLTPGRRQMWEASMAAAQTLRDGLSIPDVLDAASTSGSFAGSMRKNLVSMLDEIGVAKWLGLTSTALIWKTPEGWRLEDSTSAFLHPVFDRGELLHNYGGGDMASKLSTIPILAAFVDRVLAASLQFSPEALVIPLGKAVNAALSRLVSNGSVRPDRVLLNFPHPSGANGHRKSQFEEQKSALTAQVQMWSRLGTLAT